ncbi:MAG: 2Fe-2S iron-sulfur cluster-binding protein [Myxococcota bacterium]|nr:2Fe-2S iron-sulfur cluster-binding protein [Myxococcota bacterium]
MGLRDRLKKRVQRALGSNKPQTAPPPPPPKRPRAKAVYRDPDAELPLAVEQALEEEVGLPSPLPTPPPEPESAPAHPADPPISEDTEAPTTDIEAPQDPLPKPPINEDTTFTVRLFNASEGLDVEIEAYAGEFILDAADRLAVDLPSSCRNGGCTVCAGRLVRGSMEMEEQYVLEDEHLDQGFRLLCCAAVTSDAEIETHQDEVVA